MTYADKAKEINKIKDSKKREKEFIALLEVAGKDGYVMGQRSTEKIIPGVIAAKLRSIKVAIEAMLEAETWKS